jgi:hypothetical protein
MTKVHEEHEDTDGSCTRCVKENGYVKLYMFLFFITWVISIVLFIQNFKRLEPWAQVLGIIGLLPITPFGPLLTLVIIVLGKKQK